MKIKSRVDSRLRLRTAIAKDNDDDVLPRHVTEKSKKVSNDSLSLPIPLLHFLLFLLLMTFAYFLVVIQNNHLPEAIFVNDESAHVNRFIAERARNHLINLTSLGSRPTGSFENEVLAVGFFVRAINNIIDEANKSHQILLELQKVSGAFPLTFLDGMTNVYKNVQNVIVKIGPRPYSEHSLLVNCHFDSAIDSPGGSDDAAGCAIMLEMLRVISISNDTLKNNIIFLFNGAEENILQASHGFITQHKFAKEVRVFVNLEACGAGGKEILFQAGPEHPWILKAFAESVPYPLGSSLAQEIFHSGLVPGDTDFRIFRDFGHISGLDFAWASNGYVYHTNLDNVDQIPSGTLQRTGDNMLSLVVKLVNSPQLSNINKYKTGNLVFFDFLGVCILYTTEVFASVINVGIVISSLYTIWCNKKDSHNGTHEKTYFYKVFKSAAIVTISWFLTLFCCVFIAILLTTLNRGLSWYSTQIWIIFLYIIPTFIVPSCVALAYSKVLYSHQSSQWFVFRIYNDGNQLVFTMILALLILLKIRSGFMVSIWLLFSSISWLLREKMFSHWTGRLCDKYIVPAGLEMAGNSDSINTSSDSKKGLNKFANYKNRIKFYSLSYLDSRWLWLHISCLFIPYLLSGHAINAMIQLVVPIMGRTGSGNYAEIAFSIVISGIFVLMFSFYVPIILLVQNSKLILKGMFVLCCISILVILFTSLGFPYSGDQLAPSPQRFIVLHTERTFHGFDGKIRAYKSGLWFVNMDENSPRSISSLIPDLSHAEPILDDCQNELFCGLPYKFPVTSIMWQTHWIPAPSPAFPPPFELHMTYKDQRSDKIQRISFSVTGPDHMNLFLSPYTGVELKGWSFLSESPLEGPKWKGNPTYFVYFSCGSDPEPWNFWIDLQVSDIGHQGPVLELGLAGHIVHGTHKTTPHLRNFFAQFPSWTTTSGWTSAYKSYTF